MTNDELSERLRVLEDVQMRIIERIAEIDDM
jgi:hypothetical protein